NLGSPAKTAKQHKPIKDRDNPAQNSSVWVCCTGQSNQSAGIDQPCPRCDNENPAPDELAVHANLRSQTHQPRNQKRSIHPTCQAFFRFVLKPVRFVLHYRPPQTNQRKAGCRGYCVECAYIHATLGLLGDFVSFYRLSHTCSTFVGKVFDCIIVRNQYLKFTYTRKHACGTL